MLENVRTVSGLPVGELVDGLWKLGTDDLVQLWNSVLGPMDGPGVLPRECLGDLFKGIPLHVAARDLVRAHDAGRFFPEDPWVHVDRAGWPVSFAEWSDSRSPVDLVRIALCATREDLAEVGIGVAVPAGAWSR